MQVPTVQLAELLAELAQVEPNVTRQPGPVGVAFLDTDVAALEADEDLGVRIGIERRLEPDFELARVEVLALDSARSRVSADVPGHSDFGVELRLIALATYELRRDGIGAMDRVPAGGLNRRRSQRRKIIARWWRCRAGRRSRRTLARQSREHAIEFRAQRAHLGSEGVHLALRRLLRGGWYRKARGQNQRRAVRTCHIDVLSVSTAKLQRSATCGARATDSGEN